MELLLKGDRFPEYNDWTSNDNLIGLIFFYAQNLLLNSITICPIHTRKRNYECPPLCYELKTLNKDCRTKGIYFKAAPLLNARD